MAVQVVAYYFCRRCDVEGEDPDIEPQCWNCGGSVTVTARPAVPPERYAPEPE